MTKQTKCIARDQVKAAMKRQEWLRRMHKAQYRLEQRERWEQKLIASPFRINLVAENERLDEEHRIRSLEAIRTKKANEKHAQIKQAPASNNAQELDMLRREKRLIIQEEKRLRALISIDSHGRTTRNMRKKTDDKTENH